MFLRDYQEKMREALDLASSQIDSNKRKQVWCWQGAGANTFRASHSYCVTDNSIIVCQLIFLINY